jgi:hypothetical protein
MQRKDIKADGTIYVMKRGGRLLRVIETDRLWKYQYGSAVDKGISLAGPHDDKPEKTDFGWGGRTVGFLVIYATDKPENREILKSFVFYGAQSFPDRKALERGKETFPEGFYFDVLVPRDIEGPLEAVQDARAEQAVRDAAERARRDEVRAVADAAYRRAHALLEAHGVPAARHRVSRYDQFPERRAQVVVDAGELASLLETLNGLMTTPTSEEG